MKRWIWLDSADVAAQHIEQILEHGGSAGIRDQGLLESALTRRSNQTASGLPPLSASQPRITR